MTVRSKRRALRATAAAILIVAVGAAALVAIGNGADDDADSQGESSLSTTLISQRDLTEYTEISGTLDYEGTVTLTARSNGVLMHLAGEGTVVRQGEQLYLVVYEPTDEDTARVLAEVASAQDGLSTASDNLSEAMSGPSDAEAATARAAVTEAIEERDHLLEPPSTADLNSAQAAVAAASEALEALGNPTAADLAAARVEVANAEAALTTLKTGASQAEIDSARAAVQTASEALATLNAGASQAEIDTATAARRAARERLRDELQYSDNEVEIDLARAELLTAEEHLADLLAGPTQAEIDDAESKVLTAQEALAELLAGPTQAEIDDAESKVLTAQERLELLENPTDVQFEQARADLATARESLADLVDGASAAELESADAAVLAAEQALADLLAEPSAEELSALESSLASAEAALRSAQADAAAYAETYRPLFVMYDGIPAYRNMTVGLEGADVAQLEANLAELGFGDDEAFEVDGIFDLHTAAAVRSWQEHTDQHVDGTVSTADVLFTAGPVQIGSWGQGVEVGQDSEVGATLAPLTVIETPGGGGMATTQRVIASLPLSDRDLISVGIAVNVELPDDTDVAGSVTAINPTPALDAQSGENTVEVTILLTEPASPVWIGATVTVEVTETLIRDALVVPATALLALVEGGYAVEVLDEDGTTRLVGIETGLFVDGDVEVASGELAAGMHFVVPR